VKQNRISTDLTKVQWKLIKPMLPSEALGRPARIPRKRVVDALWFVVVTGIQWRLLPSRFPAWQTVYYHFARWSRAGVWRRLHHTLRVLVRQKMGRRKHASAACLDSQSVKTSRAGGARGFDMGKKVKGRKRHLLTDTQGLALEVLVTPANVSENAGAKALWRRAGRRRGPAKRVRRVWVDQGYKNGLIPWCCARCGVEVEIVQTPTDPKGFAVQPKRWVVERTFGWLSPCRRLSLDYERLTPHSETMIWIALARVLVRRLA
jgi:transposase